MNAAILLFSLGSMWFVARLLDRTRFNIYSNGYAGLCVQSLFGCIVFFLCFYFYEWHFMSSLDAFDLNHDGVFSPEEISSGQIAALDAYINDAGRNIFKVMAPVIFTLVAAGRSLAFWLRKRSRDKAN